MELDEARSRKRLTLEDLKGLQCETLTPLLAAKFLGVHPYSINVAVRNAPELVRYPFTVTGRRVLIPRAGFIAWAEGERK